MMPEQEEVFNMLDTNGDGKLSAEEFVIIWKSPQYGMAIFKEWDANRDGFITREEFTRFNPGGELLPTDKER